MKHHNKQDGFTLLEILVALAVLAVLTSAFVSATSGSIKQTAHLRDKVVANLVATNALTEIRVLGEWPEVGTNRQTVDMATQRWQITIAISDTDTASMRRVDVSVALESNTTKPMAILVGFVSNVSIPITTQESWDGYRKPSAVSAGFLLQSRRNTIQEFPILES